MADYIPSQTRVIDPYEEYNSNATNRLTRMISNNTDCIVASDPITFDSTGETILNISGGSVIKDDVQIRIEDTTVNLSNPDLYTGTSTYNGNLSLNDTLYPDEGVDGSDELNDIVIASNGHLYACGEYGLHSFSISGGTPSNLDSHALTWEAQQIAVDSNDYIFVTESSLGLGVYSANPTTGIFSSENTYDDLTSGVQGVTTYGNYVFIAGGSEVASYTNNNDGSLSLISVVETGYSGGYRITTNGSLVAVQNYPGASNNYVTIYIIQSNGELALVNAISQEGGPTDVYFDEKRLYVTDPSFGVKLYKMDNDTGTETLLDSYDPLSGATRRVCTYKDQVYWANYSQLLYLLRTGDELALSGSKGATIANGVIADENYVYLVGSYGLKVYSKGTNTTTYFDDLPGYYYLVLEYTYNKIRPAPEASLKLLTPAQRYTDYDTNSHVLLKVIQSDSNLSIGNMFDYDPDILSNKVAISNTTEDLVINNNDSTSEYHVSVFDRVVFSNMSQVVLHPASIKSVHTIVNNRNDGIVEVYAEKYSDDTIDSSKYITLVNKYDSITIASDGVSIWIEI